MEDELSYCRCVDQKKESDGKRMLTNNEGS